MQINLKNKFHDFKNEYMSPMIFKLAFYDFSKLYKGSFLGIFWAFFKPVFSSIIFYLGNVAMFGANYNELLPSGFPLWMPLIMGMVVWQYLSDSINNAPNVAGEYSFMITKMKYRKSKIYLFTNISKYLQHFVLIFIFSLIYIIVGIQNKSDYSILLLQLPFLVLCMVVFFFCWTTFISPLCIISRDVRELVALFVICAFWVSGVFFDPNDLITESSTSIQKAIYQLVCINPLATFISIYKISFFGASDTLLVGGLSASNYEWFFQGEFYNGIFVGFWYKFLWIGIWCVVFALLGLLISKKTKTWINDLL